jgi:hypothetical protein
MNFFTSWGAESREEGLGTRNNLQIHAPNDLLPPTRLFLWKFSEPFQIALPAGDHDFNT